MKQAKKRIHSKKPNIFYIASIIFFIVSLCIHGFYYYSAHWSHSLDIFFEHVTIGQDFYQVPNGAQAWLKGKSLNGGQSYYMNCCGVNSNKYHPLFTLLVGLPLQTFHPQTALMTWIAAHTLVTLISIFILWKTFSKHPHIYLALGIYLINPFHYYEIQHAHYHFLFTFVSFLMILTLYKRKDGFASGLLFFLTLLIKPIGLLWIIPFFIAKQYKTAITGVVCFCLTTIPLYFWTPGTYYITNLITMTQRLYPSYNLLALSYFFPSIMTPFMFTRYIMAIVLVLFQIKKKPPLIQILFFWYIYQLFFYGGVYHYYYATVPMFITLLILTDNFPFNRFTINGIILLTLPTPIVLFHLLKIPAVLPNVFSYTIALWSAISVLFIVIGIIIGKKKNIS